MLETFSTCTLPRLAFSFSVVLKLCRTQFVRVMIEALQLLNASSSQFELKHAALAGCKM
jgi:hypothetical protein